MLSTIPLRLLIAVFAALFATAASAEDGHDLWLRYEPLPASVAAREHRYVEGAAAYGKDRRVAVAAREFNGAVAALLNIVPNERIEQSAGEVILGTAADLKHENRFPDLHLDTSGLGSEGYLIRSVDVGTGPTIVVTGNTGAAVLYGTFALIREIQLGHPLNKLNMRSAPAHSLRMLDHWDNLDRTVERGYAGPSIWDWASLPKIDPRYVDYARADASIGINGVVLNNVNADPKVLTPEYLGKVAALANVFRPYGLRVYLSVRFSSPVEIGHLKTADPMDAKVKAWWRTKADEIYRLIPEFGGFVVKANSEGEPGPWDYHRTQADGANVIADSLAPHGGTVFWRAFVYSANGEDRARQAYDEFKPLDGKFRRNVIVQVKNGPIDFQPREPFSALFGQMPGTKIGLEVQLTREYLGGTDGIVFLAPMWSEVLDSDTCSPGCGTPVKSTIAAMAGVANIGSDRNWTGSNFNQANWYAFGRLAWNPSLTPQQIAGEWTRMTWSNDARAVKPVVAMMLGSREAVVNYMTPLGLAHQFQNDHHYGPAPWSCNLSEADWNPCYYNKADSGGIGFDRTKSGSDAVDQYAPPVASRLADLKTVPDKYLLFFHHLPWTYRMRDGRTLWVSLIGHYDRGVATVEANREEWKRLRPYVDPQRFDAVADDLHRQVLEAWWWRDASIAYWQILSKLPLPAGHSPPAHPLSWYEAVHFDTVPGFKKPRIDARTLCVAGRGGSSCALSSSSPPRH
jgi:alpha-glucuronidase